jgi:hypothetical protein
VLTYRFTDGDTLSGLPDDPSSIDPSSLGWDTINWAPIMDIDTVIQHKKHAQIQETGEQAQVDERVADALSHLPGDPSSIDPSSLDWDTINWAPIMETDTIIQHEEHTQTQETGEQAHADERVADALSHLPGDPSSIDHWDTINWAPIIEIDAVIQHEEHTQIQGTGEQAQTDVRVGETQEAGRVKQSRPGRDKRRKNAERIAKNRKSKYGISKHGSSLGHRAVLGPLVRVND